MCSGAHEAICVSMGPLSPFFFLLLLSFYLFCWLESDLQAVTALYTSASMDGENHCIRIHACLDGSICVNEKYHLRASI